MRHIRLVFLAVAPLVLIGAGVRADDAAPGGPKGRSGKAPVVRKAIAECMRQADLSDAQKADIKAVNAKFKQQMAEVHKSDIPPDEKQEKLRALAAERRAAMDQLLTPAQREAVQKCLQEKMKDAPARQPKARRGPGTAPAPAG